jgi:hypothetical protein
VPGREGGDTSGPTGRWEAPAVETSPVYYGALPRRRRRRQLRPQVLAAALLAIALAATSIVVAEWLFTDGTSSATSTDVHLTSVTWHFSGPAGCWGTMVESGRTVGSSQQVLVSVSLSYDAMPMAPMSCTATAVSVSTAGFSLVRDNAPLVVHTGDTASLNVTVETPATAYTGALALAITATSP